MPSSPVQQQAFSNQIIKKAFNWDCGVWIGVPMPELFCDMEARLGRRA